MNAALTVLRLTSSRKTLALDAGHGNRGTRSCTGCRSTCHHHSDHRSTHAAQKARGLGGWCRMAEVGRAVGSACGWMQAPGWVWMRSTESLIRLFVRLVAGLGPACAPVSSGSGGHCPSCGGSPHAEDGQAREVDRGGQQPEVRVDAGGAADPGSSSAVPAAHEVAQLAFDLGPGAAVVRDPVDEAVAAVAAR